jgi:hypothetical protein
LGHTVRWGRASGGFALQPGSVALIRVRTPDCGPAPPDDLQKPHALGRSPWTPIHVRSAFYDVEGWKSGGRADLYPLLVEEVGDVAGKDLLHRPGGFFDIAEAHPFAWVPEPYDARLPLLYSLEATKP